MKIETNKIQFTIGLNIEQAGVILEALSALPYKQVSGLLEGIRGVALQAIKDAEVAAPEAAANAAPAADAPAEGGVAA